MSTVRPRVSVPSAAAASVGARILIAYLCVPWYLRDVLGLDHGGGG